MISEILFAAVAKILFAMANASLLFNEAYISLSLSFEITKDSIYMILSSLLIPSSA
jgi:hypothetical protein